MPRPAAAAPMLASLALLMPSLSVAQALSGGEASALLFPPRPAEVEILGGILPDDQARMLAMVARDQPYYAAIAISPDEGLMSEATMAAANHHTIDAAAAVALAQCNEKRKGAADCVIVATVRPEGWEARPLQLSSSATEDFIGQRGGALALSAATGAWGIGASGDEALAACAARQQAATDCTVAIAD